MPFRQLLCHPTIVGKIHSFRLECPQCGSFWDRDYMNEPFIYHDDYPEQRSHFQSDIGKNKIHSFNSWLKTTGLTFNKQLKVCEVGFGAGWILGELGKSIGAKNIYGVEAVSSNHEHAVQLGAIPEHLFYPNQLPEKLGNPIDLWIFQDSFEHILEPRPFLKWLLSISSENSQIMVIAPRADSLSRLLMRRYWIHKIQDHHFHWSANGLKGIFSEFCFEVIQQFYPMKFVSGITIKNHLKLLLPNFITKITDVIPFPGIRFNFGEMGFLLRRCDGSQKKTVN